MINIKTEGTPFINLLSYPFQSSTRTIDGLTFTDNFDGTITANGTANNNSAALELYDFGFADIPPLPAGKYVLSGCPAGGADDTYHIEIRFRDSEGNGVTVDGGASLVVVDYGNGKAFTLDRDATQIYCQIYTLKGVTCENLVFRPMLNVGNVAAPWSPPTSDRKYGDTFTDLTKRDYVTAAFIGCTGVDCFPYTGVLPTGYASIEEWANTAEIQKYILASAVNRTEETKQATITDARNARFVKLVFTADKDYDATEFTITNGKETQTNTNTTKLYAGTRIEVDGVAGTVFITVNGTTYNYTTSNIGQALLALHTYAGETVFTSTLPFVATYATTGGALLYDAEKVIPASTVTTQLIQSGACVVPTTYTDVTFNTPFKSVPHVVATFAKTGANVAGDFGVLKIYNITETGFSIRFGGDWATSLDVNWIAVGEGGAQ